MQVHAHVQRGAEPHLQWGRARQAARGAWGTQEGSSCVTPGGLGIGVFPAHQMGCLLPNRRTLALRSPGAGRQEEGLCPRRVARLALLALPCCSAADLGWVKAGGGGYSGGCWAAGRGRLWGTESAMPWSSAPRVQQGTSFPGEPLRLSGANPRPLSGLSSQREAEWGQRRPDGWKAAPLQARRGTDTWGGRWGGLEPARAPGALGGSRARGRLPVCRPGALPRQPGLLPSAAPPPPRLRPPSRWGAQIGRARV